MSAAACFRFLFVLLCALVSLSTIGAHACSTTSQDVFSVGNKAADATCNYGSIQQAIDAATCAAGTKIILNSSGDYTNQHLTITNKNISLIGRADTPKCNTLQAACGTLIPCPQAPLRTISGNIKVRGASNVTIQYLDITQGHGVADSNGTTYGGGIDYAATGELHLYTTTVDYNTAYNGGGIRFQGYGGPADLYLHQHTQVDYNTATNGGSGGGIRVEGDATLHADEPDITIHDNTAADKGGGIAVIGPASAHIGSSGGFFLGRLGVVYNNSAHNGGGIAVIAQSTGSAEVDLLATDPANPVLVQNNYAYQGNGGGVYLVPYIYTEAGGAVPTNPAVLHMEGAHIDGNAANEGAGIYADVNSVFAYVAYAYAGGWVNMYSGSSCATGQECNSVSNNRAVTLDSHGNEISTAGSAILIQTNGIFAAQQLAMRGNQGAHAIRVADGLNSPLALDTCLFAGNIVSAELITLASASASINQCTIANNTNIAEGYVLVRANANLTLTNSIFAQGSQQSVLDTNTGATMNLDYVMAQETASLLALGGTHIIQADPAFVDPGHGDYHLGPYSPAIDVAPPVTGDDRDLENLPRDHDLANVPNINGDRDLGAYERQFECAADTIFCNGFEP
jgi:predicted outer membrane repeat protein